MSNYLLYYTSDIGCTNSLLFTRLEFYPGKSRCNSIILAPAWIDLRLMNPMIQVSCPFSQVTRAGLS